MIRFKQGQTLFRLINATDAWFIVSQIKYRSTSSLKCSFRSDTRIYVCINNLQSSYQHYLSKRVQNASLFIAFMMVRR